MSTHILELIINCGEKTCAEAPGKFCHWLKRQNFGTVYYCHLFSSYTSDFGDMKFRYMPLKEKDGWIQRHERCLGLEGHRKKGTDGNQ